jgi:hypothetical protein
VTPSRVQDPADRCRNRVTATTAGLAALDGFDRAITEAADDMLARFGPADRARLIALLERLVSAPEQAAAETSHQTASGPAAERPGEAPR